jgi:hypothetical protein
VSFSYSQRRHSRLCRFPRALHLFSYSVTLVRYSLRLRHLSLFILQGFESSLFILCFCQLFFHWLSEARTFLCPVDAVFVLQHLVHERHDDSFPIFESAFLCGASFVCHLHRPVVREYNGSPQFIRVYLPA